MNELNSGDTAWMLISTVLVLLMTVPGLSLFYAGMVRTKNVPSVFMQCFAITALMTILWMVYGYSLAFDAGNAFDRLRRSLDVFGVHAVGGIVGAILTGVFASDAFGGAGLDVSIGTQVGRQIKGVIFTILYTGILSALLYKLVDLTIGMRVSDEDEALGLDLSSHNERGYVL